MWLSGKKLWGSIKSALGVDSGYPFVSITVQLPMQTSRVKPMTRPAHWQYIVIHHSFTRDEATTRNWDAIRKYHKEINGWADIGYHFGLERDLSGIAVLEGRPLSMDGAHAIGFNRNGIGICVVGNYDIDPPSADRLEVLRGLVTKLMVQFNIPVDNVIGHRETYLLRGVKVEKSCPGANFDMHAFRKSLSA